MRYAIVNGERTEPTPKAQGTCPHCAAHVHSKCGDVVVWHWAHTKAQDCDSWAERDTEWHRDWQNQVPPEQREIKIGKHRADIVARDGTVVEVQHSYLPAEAIRQREAHYGRMVWIYDATDPFAEGRLNFRQREGYVSFRWKHPRKTLGATRRPVLLDVGDDLLFRIKRIHLESGRPCGGWGYWVNFETIRSWLVREPVAAA